MTHSVHTQSRYWNILPCAAAVCRSHFWRVYFNITTTATFFDSNDEFIMEIFRFARDDLLRRRFIDTIKHVVSAFA